MCGQQLLYWRAQTGLTDAGNFCENRVIRDRDARKPHGTQENKAQWGPREGLETRLAASGE